MSLLADHNLPFAVALAFMALLALVQAIGLDFGGDADADMDLDADGDLEGGSAMPDGGIGAAAASMLGLGRVPITVWLAVFLFVFAALGVGIQGFATSLTGGPLDRWLAALFAAGAALPVTGVVVRPIGRILPKDETSAVTLDTLVGRRAEIVTGTARHASPARGRVIDAFGHPHHVMIEPHAKDGQIVEGEQVLLVRREGELFFGQALETRNLSPAR
ncbi:OB-fold-containig protein [Qipengyuania sp. JC766]|uniref:OB-fold-containig protein n=1 Tax=Qipengyuania sp. JC766 TaxID=3232139 RepID=UPI003458CE6C